MRAIKFCEISELRDMTTDYVLKAKTLMLYL